MHLPANNWAKLPGIHLQPTWPSQNYYSTVKLMNHYCTKADPSSPTNGAESSTQRQLSHQHHSSSTFLSLLQSNQSSEAECRNSYPRITGKLIVSQAIVSLIDFFVNFIVLNKLNSNWFAGHWSAWCQCICFCEQLRQHPVFAMHWTVTNKAFTLTRRQWIQLPIKSLINYIINCIFSLLFSCN